jgi:hypothetical protein
MFYVIVVVQTQLGYAGLVAEQMDACVPEAVEVVQHFAQQEHQLGAAIMPTDSAVQVQETTTAD